MNRLLTYSREVVFIWRNCIGLRNRFLILKYLVLFHLSNMVPRLRYNASPFHLKLLVAPSRRADIVIRPFSGDLFVLFEVMMERPYHIPETMLPRNDVTVVLDCGANIGMTSLYFASNYPNAHIYSIEPDPKNFELLTENTKSEPRIVPIHGALVGYPRKSARLSTCNPAWGNFLTENGEGIEVPAFTVDQIIQDHALPHVDLLKVDIEGGEKEVFANGRFLPQVEFIIIELHDGYGLSEFVTDVTRWGFRAIPPGECQGLSLVAARSMRRTLEAEGLVIGEHQ
jgi:FkbM family methyltransferase